MSGISRLVSGILIYPNVQNLSKNCCKGILKPIKYAAQDKKMKYGLQIIIGII
jgi:hypothetical protein